MVFYHYLSCDVSFPYDIKCFAARAVNCLYISICGSMVASQLVCLTLDQTVRVQALLICGIVFCSWARHFTHSVPLTTQGQIVQKVDNTVQRIAWFVSLTLTVSSGKKMIYPVDSVIQPLNKRLQVYKCRLANLTL